MSQLKFNPKRDVSAYLLVWGPMILVPVSLFFLIAFKEALVGTLIFLSLASINIWFWVRTYYLISEDALEIRNGPIRKKIFYTDIQEVRRTKSMSANPAYSVNRIQIIHTKGAVSISPNQLGEFIEIIQEKNCDIEINL
ncbi:PH domain-containing protein [Mechercharimyces sp. CAU 1602]|uniref:PH domain-containing protein n=1 Tax=Mechercharimyces sp. CAU 1602 TaxID=2973933 RepID=UPI002162903E|nr:PH domain-containing protein [Mechercharimyces sp. CAU 1602]MCS1352712.1 PH domain-containing protein [Mechercharimyces sp. CAU 1602]